MVILLAGPQKAEPHDPSNMILSGHDSVCSLLPFGCGFAALRPPGVLFCMDTAQHQHFSISAFQLLPV
jgi:hypothetical protein